MAETFIPSAEDVDKQLLAEFVDEAHDTLGMLDVQLENLRSGSGSFAETYMNLRRHTVTMIGQSQSVGLHALTLVAQRLDSYLSEAGALNAENLTDVQAFVDRLNAILDGGQAGAALVDEARLVRELPKKKSAVDFEVEIPKDVEVMTVIPEKAMSHIVEKELAACGLRAHNVRSPYQAFEQVVRTKPDLVICAMELGALSGVDLALAFAAMAKTATIPFALLTSYQWGHPALEGLPPRAALLHKGGAFGDDLAQALSRFGIL